MVLIPKMTLARKDIATGGRPPEVFMLMWLLSHLISSHLISSGSFGQLTSAFNRARSTSAGTLC